MKEQKLRTKDYYFEDEMLKQNGMRKDMQHKLGQVEFYLEEKKQLLLELEKYKNELGTIKGRYEVVG